ncbi:hypothetical protein N9N67_05960 [Bacteriovoracaceae bacterium]|nr:hypothetical protein [Bacteriovoracaceae bacterium]
MKQVLILISLLLVYASTSHSKTMTNFEHIYMGSNFSVEDTLSVKVKTVLQKHFGLELSSKSFKLVQKQDSLLGSHFRFIEVKEGIQIQDSEIVLSIDQNDYLYKVHDNVADSSSLKKLKLSASITSRYAEGIAYDSLGGYAELLEYPMANLVIHNGRLVYIINMNTVNPRGDYEIVIDANTEDIISSRDVRIYRHLKSIPKKVIVKGKKKLNYFTDAYLELVIKKNKTKSLITESSIGKGYGQIFKPNPVTTLKNDKLEDNSEAYIFKPAYRKVTLENLLIKDGVYHLKSDLVELKNFESPNTSVTTSKSGDFTGERNSSTFTDTMTYYHLYDSIQYLKNLGFKNSKLIFKKAMIADSDAVYGSDNSYFSPAQNALAFGHGCVDDNEDSDVILHELGHAINFNINNSWRGGDTGAMGEGFGDYWAASYAYLQENGTFLPNRVFKWDGHNKCWGGRMVNKVNMKYNHNTTYGAHVRMDGGVTDELWSTPIFQAFKELVDKGESADSLQAIIIESQFGMGSGVKMRDWANSIVQTAKKMFPNKKYDEVYKKYFKNQKIIR